MKLWGAVRAWEAALWGAVRAWEAARRRLVSRLAWDAGACRLEVAFRQLAKLAGLGVAASQLRPESERCGECGRRLVDHVRVLECPERL